VVCLWPGLHLEAVTALAANDWMRLRSQALAA